VEPVHSFVRGCPAFFILSQSGLCASGLLRECLISVPAESTQKQICPPDSHWSGTKSPPLGEHSGVQLGFRGFSRCFWHSVNFFYNLTVILMEVKPSKNETPTCLHYFNGGLSRRVCRRLNWVKSCVGHLSGIGTFNISVG
jgi:hypothetical protein